MSRRRAAADKTLFRTLMMTKSGAPKRAPSFLWPPSSSLPAAAEPRISITGFPRRVRPRRKPPGSRSPIGPLVLPSYVDRAELVFQSGPNQFEIPAKALWAGAIQDNFGQVLATDIGRHLASGNVVSNPAPGDARFRYRVSVTVRQFHAISGEGAILDAAWRVEDASTRQGATSWRRELPRAHQRRWLCPRGRGRERPRRDRLASVDHPFVVSGTRPLRATRRLCLAGARTRSSESHRK